MAPPKSTKPVEPTPWDWASHTKAEDVGLAEFLKVYRIAGFPNCTERKRNCKKNPKCLWGLGEKKWLEEEDPNVSNATANEDAVNEALRNEGQIVGIQNLGATCYVNSLLQLWFHNPILRPAILEWQPPSEEIVEPINYAPTCPIGQLQAMFARLKLSKQSSIDPSSFVQALGLNAGEQQDAQEFSKLLMTLIDDLLEKNQHQKIRNLIKDSFTGEFQYETMCSVCHNLTSRSSVFNELELTVNKNLRESLEQYLKEEILEGPNQYQCSVCKKNQNAQRSIKLKKLPPVLNLQLMRFVYDLDTQRKKKVLTVMRFPEELDMTEHVSDEFRGGKTLIYKLTAVLVHNGKSASSGHYIAHIKDINTGAWYDCNDESVAKKPQTGRKTSALVINDGDSQELANGTSTKESTPKPKSHSSPGAYMLVYTQRELLENPPPDPVIHKYLVHLVKREDVVFESELAKTKAEKELEDQKRDERQKEVEQLYKTRGTSNTAKLAQSIGSSNNIFKKQKISANVNGVEPMDVDGLELANLAFLPSSWIANWLNDKNNIVDEICLTSLICQHEKLKPPSSNDTLVLYRVVPKSFADAMYLKYGGQGLLHGDQAFCKICVQEHCRVIQKLNRLDEDHKRFVELMKQTDVLVDSKAKKFTEEFLHDKVWIAKEDARSWKRLAKDEIMREHLEYERSRDSIEIVRPLNSDSRCEHGELIPTDNNRKLLSVEAWSIVTEYFTDAVVFAGRSRICRTCDEITNNNNQAVAQHKAIAQKQKTELLELYFDKYKRPDPCAQPGDYYVVPTRFVEQWRRCVKNSASAINFDELQICNNELLCDDHNKFKFPLDLISTMQKERATKETSVTIIKPSEWNFLKTQYTVDSEIKIISSRDFPDLKLKYVPEICVECSSQWYQEAMSQTLHYSSEDIYVEKKDEEEDCDSLSVSGDDDFQTVNYQVPSKRDRKDLFPITNGTRRSTRAKHTKNQKKYQVHSTMTIKDLQLRLMNDYKAMMSDQHLFYRGKELPTKNREATLGELQILPGSTIYLKVDKDVSKDDDSIEIESPVQEQERGFSGTVLQGFNTQLPMEQ